MRNEVPFPNKFPYMDWDEILRADKGFVRWCMTEGITGNSDGVPPHIVYKMTHTIFDYKKANEQQAEVLKLIQSGQHVIVKGLPGTGKTFALLQISGDIIVSAPTGRSALNVQGKTTFSHFRINYKDHLIEVGMVPKAQVYIFDEIFYTNPSQVYQIILAIRSKHPKATFVFSGDPLQLAPVPPKDISDKVKDIFDDDEDAVTWYQLFNIRSIYDVFKKLKMKVIPYALTEPMRQTDKPTFEILKAARTQSLNKKQLATLNKLVRAKAPKDCVQLVATNAERRKLNAIYLKSFTTFEILPEKKISDEQVIAAYIKKYARAKFLIDLVEKFKKKKLKPEVLAIGAKVMITQNSRPSGFYVNGDTGTLLQYNHMTHTATVKLTRGGTVQVGRHWFGKFGESHDAVKVGHYAVPITVAYAMTIHKTQGLTIEENVHINIHPFLMSRMDGLLYTALTRIKRLDQLTLSKPIYNSYLKNKKDA